MNKSPESKKNQLLTEENRKILFEAIDQFIFGSCEENAFKGCISKIQSGGDDSNEGLKTQNRLEFEQMFKKALLAKFDQEEIDEFSSKDETGETTKVKLNIDGHHSCDEVITLLADEYCLHFTRNCNERIIETNQISPTRSAEERFKGDSHFDRILIILNALKKLEKDEIRTIQVPLEFTATQVKTLLDAINGPNKPLGHVILDEADDSASIFSDDIIEEERSSLKCYHKIQTVIESECQDGVLNKPIIILSSKQKRVISIVLLPKSFLTFENGLINDSNEKAAIYAFDSVNGVLDIKSLSKQKVFITYLEEGSYTKQLEPIFKEGFNYIKNKAPPKSRRVNCESSGLWSIYNIFMLLGCGSHEFLMENQSMNLDELTLRLATILSCHVDLKSLFGKNFRKEVKNEIYDIKELKELEEKIVTAWDLKVKESQEKKKQLEENNGDMERTELEKEKQILAKKIKKLAANELRIEGAIKESQSSFPNGRDESKVAEMYERFLSNDEEDRIREKIKTASEKKRQILFQNNELEKQKFIEHEINSLTLKIEDHTKKYHAKVAKKERLQEESSQLEETLKKTEQEILDYQNRIAQTKTDCLSLEKQRTAIQKENDKVNLLNISNNWSNCLSTLKMLNGDEYRKFGSLEKDMADIDELTNNLAKIRIEIKRLNEIRAKNDQAIDQKKRNLSKIECSIREIRQEFFFGFKKLFGVSEEEKLVQEQKSLNSGISELQVESQRSQTDRKNQESLEKEHEEKLKVTENNLQKNTKLLRDAILATNNQKIQNFQQKISQKERDIVGFQQKIKNLENSREDLKELRAEKEKDNEFIQNDIKNIISHIERFENQISKMSQELGENLLPSLSLVSRSLSTDESFIESKIDNEKKILEWQKQLLAIKEELTQLRSDEKKVKDRISDLTEDKGKERLIFMQEMEREEKLLEAHLRKLTLFKQANIENARLIALGRGIFCQSKLENLIKTISGVVRNKVEMYNFLQPKISTADEIKAALDEVKKVKKMLYLDEKRKISQDLVMAICNRVNEKAKKVDMVEKIKLLEKAENSINFNEILLYQHTEDFLVLLPNEIEGDHRKKLHRMINLLLHDELLEELCFIKFKEKAEKEVQKIDVLSLYKLFKEIEREFLRHTPGPKLLESLTIKNFEEGQLSERILGRLIDCLKVIYRKMEDYDPGLLDDVHRSLKCLQDALLNRIKIIVQEEGERRKREAVADIEFDFKGEISDKIKEKEDEIKNLDNEIRMNEEEVTRVGKEISQVRERLERAKKHHLERGKKIAKEIGILQDKLQTEKQKLKKTQEDVKEAKAEQKEIDLKIQEINQKISEFEKEKTELEDEIKKIEEQKGLITAEQNKISVKKAVLEKEKQQRENEEKVLKASINGLQKWIKFMENVYNKFLETKALFEQRKYIKETLEGKQTLLEKYEFLIGIKELQDFRSSELKQEAKKNYAPIREILMSYLNKILAKPTILRRINPKGMEEIEATGLIVSFEEVMGLIQEEIKTQLQNFSLCIKEKTLTLQKDAQSMTFGRVFHQNTQAPEGLLELIDRCLKTSYQIDKKVFLNNGRLDIDCSTKDGVKLADKLFSEVLSDLQISYHEVLKAFCTSIKIISGHHIYVEPDDVKIKGINLWLKAGGDIILPKGFTLDVSGSHARNFKNPQAFGFGEKDEPAQKLKVGQNGRDGFDGLCGDNSGNIYINAGRKIHNLTLIKEINFSGGMGGKGQKGGAGQTGGEGESTGDAEAEDFGPCVFNPAFSAAFARIPGWDPDTQDFTIESEKSGRGGNAGKAGFGGEGGFEGRILIKDSEMWIKSIQNEIHYSDNLKPSFQDKKIFIHNLGSQGEDAPLDVKGGQAGKPGTYGCDHVIYVDSVWSKKNKLKGDYSNYLLMQPEGKSREITRDESKMKRKSIFDEPDLYAKRSASYTTFSTIAAIAGGVLAVAAVATFAFIIIPAVGIGGLIGGIIAAGWQAVALTTAKCLLAVTLASFAFHRVYETARGTKVKQGVDEKRKKKNMSEIAFENRYCDDPPLRDEQETRTNPRKSEFSRGLNGEDSQRKEESEREEHARSKERNNEIEDENEIAHLEAKAAQLTEDEERKEQIERLNREIAEYDKKIENNAKEMANLQEKIESESSTLVGLERQIQEKKQQKESVLGKISDINEMLQAKDQDLKHKEAELLNNLDQIINNVKAESAQKIAVELKEIMLNGEEELKTKFDQAYQKLRRLLEEEVSQMEIQKEKVNADITAKQKEKSRKQNELSVLQQEELHSLKKKEMRTRQLADLAELKKKLNEEKRNEMITTTEVTLIRDKKFEKPKEEDKKRPVSVEGLTQEKLDKDGMETAIVKDPEGLNPGSEIEQKPLQRENWKIEMARKKRLGLDKKKTSTQISQK